MSEEKRMLGNYEVTQSIYVGDKEVVLAVDKKEQYPFLVCYCDYHNPLSAAWATEGVASDDYLEAMEIFTERVQSQIDCTRAELSKFPFDKAVFTKEHCIPDDHKSNIVGKVVVLNAEPKRYEYQHPAYQLNLCGKAKYKVDLGFDPLGNLTRIENELAKLPARLEAAKTKRTETIAQFETAKVEVQKPFAFEGELKEKSERLNALNIELNLDKKDPAVLDAEPEQSEEQPERKCENRER